MQLLNRDNPARGGQACKALAAFLSVEFLLVASEPHPALAVEPGQ